MMLDEFSGSLRFQMRLYNRLGYTAMLSAPLNGSLRLPKRVSIEHETTGIYEIQASRGLKCGLAAICSVHHGEIYHRENGSSFNRDLVGRS
jgi:hypothetical protein